MAEAIGLPEMTGAMPRRGRLAVGSTRMVKGPTDPVWRPSLAVMVMSADNPSSPAPGVPVKAPVVASKLAHWGWPSIAYVTGAPFEATDGV